MTHPARVAEGPKSRRGEWLNCSFMWDDEQVHRSSGGQRPRPLPNTSWRKCSGQREAVGRQGERDTFIFWIARLGHSAKFKKTLQMWVIARVLTGECLSPSRHHRKKRKLRLWLWHIIAKKGTWLYNMARVWKYSDPCWHGNGQRAAGCSHLLLCLLLCTFYLHSLTKTYVTLTQLTWAKTYLLMPSEYLQRSAINTPHNSEYEASGAKLWVYYTHSVIWDFLVPCIESRCRWQKNNRAPANSEVIQQ